MINWFIKLARNCQHRIVIRNPKGTDAITKTDLGMTISPRRVNGIEVILADENNWQLLECGKLHALVECALFCLVTT